MPVVKPTLKHVTDVTSAEVGDFIHVNPEAIVGRQLVEGLQLLLPVLHSLLAEEVQKMCRSWPYLHIQQNSMEQSMY